MTELFDNMSAQPQERNVASYRIDGSLKNLQQLREELEAELPGVDVQPREEPPKPGARRAAGMEPLTYMLVAFVAHLAASLTHDGIHALLSRLAKKHDVAIKEVDEQVDERKP